jgi:hypothetical protein
MLLSMTSDSRELIQHSRIERDRSARRLADAIAGADRWYARREATLAAFDRDATETVTRLRAAGRISASIAWDPAGS